MRRYVAGNGSLSAVATTVPGQGGLRLAGDRVCDAVQNNIHALEPVDPRSTGGTRGIRSPRSSQTICRSWSTPSSLVRSPATGQQVLSEGKTYVRAGQVRVHTHGCLPSGGNTTAHTARCRRTGHVRVCRSFLLSVVLSGKWSAWGSDDRVVGSSKPGVPLCHRPLERR